MGLPIDEIIAGLNPAQKAALRLMIDLPSASLSRETRKFLSRHAWSGVILFSKNVQSGPALHNLIREIRVLAEKEMPGFPPFVAVDQEGGSVSPLENLVTPSPGNMALAAAGNPEDAYHLSRQTGRDLRKLGFNVNFSPVLDVNSNPRNPIIGIRSFGGDAQTVSRFGSAVIRGTQEEGILATAKHFPGHGDTSKDSHFELPVVDRSRDTLEQIDFPPFEKAVKAGVWGIMTAHVIYPGLDSKPATLSRVILTELLRQKMGFEGIIFTDSFEMAAIKEHFSLEEAVVESVRAGADVLLALGAPQIQLQIFSILKKAIEKKKLTQEEIIPPLRRILAFRKKLADFKPGPLPRVSPHWVETIHEKCVTLISGGRKVSLPDRPRRVLLSPEATPHTLLFKKYFPNWQFIPWPWPAGSHADAVFFGEKRLLSAEAEEALGRYAPSLECAAAFGNPYILGQLPGVPVRLTTYHLSEMLVKAARGVLLEGKEAEGKLPISL